MRARDETEGWVGRVRLSVLKSVPPCVCGAEDLAGNIVPVSLGVLSAGNGSSRWSTADWPAGFSDPNWLATGSGCGVAVGLKEELSTILDSVGILGLKVWV